MAIDFKHAAFKYIHTHVFAYLKLMRNPTQGPAILMSTFKRRYPQNELSIARPHMRTCAQPEEVIGPQMQLLEAEARVQHRTYEKNEANLILAALIATLNFLTYTRLLTKKS